MWADTLLVLERGHLLRVLAWGCGSVLCGTLLLLTLLRRNAKATMLRLFGMYLAVGGAVEAAIALSRWPLLQLRDFAGLQRLVSVLWLTTGVSIGLVGAGLLLVVLARRMRESGTLPAASTGAGIAVIVQGLAMLLLHVRLIVAIGPLR